MLWKDIDVIPQDWGQRKRYRVGDECCLGCAPFDMSLEHLRGSIRRVGRVALRGSTWRGKAGRSLHHTQGDLNPGDRRGERRGIILTEP